MFAPKKEDDNKNRMYYVYGLLSLFAITGLSVIVSAGIDGSGTQDYLSRWTNSTYISTGGIYDNGSYLNTSYQLYELGSRVCTVANGLCVGTSDLNNYSTGLSVSGSSTKTIQISRNGMTNLSASFTDSDTTYTAGYGINVTGTTFSVANLTACNPVTEYSVWNGTQWSCDTDSAGGSGTVTSITAGEGLTGGTITISGTITANYSAIVLATGNWSQASSNYTTTTQANSLYYLKTNPASFYNSTTIPSYALLTQLDNTTIIRQGNGSWVSAQVGNWSQASSNYTLSTNLVGAVGNFTQALSNVSALQTSTTSLNTSINSIGNWTQASSNYTKTFTNYTDTLVQTSSATAYSTLTNLTTTLAASSRYVIACNFITFSAAATTGEQLQVNITGTAPTSVRMVFNSQQSATTRQSFNSTSTTTNSFADTGSNGINLDDISNLAGYIRTGAGTATLNYYVKSEVGASNIGFAPGSECTYTKVA